MFDVLADTIALQMFLPSN